MTALPHPFLALAASALQLPGAALTDIAIHGPGELPSAFAVTDLAAASIGAATAAVRELAVLAGAGRPPMRVDRRLASLWFSASIQPIGWALPAAWDAIAGDYRSADGWIRLHTNAPHHRAAALRVLDCVSERDAVARAVAAWQSDALEAAVVEAGGCAAAMRTSAQWRVHPQGVAVAGEPLVAWTSASESSTSAWRPHARRPLAGLKVLDLTRILAGPVATRFLAGHGADVLRIDPPDWEEDALAPEVTLGKRCGRLDLENVRDRATFESLLSRADALVHGYRPGALEALGYATACRRRLNPGLVDVSLDAYGWSGPWQGRRGFDSLLQMSTGIAQRGMQWQDADAPKPLPVQALDHATGYLIAAAVASGLAQRLRDGRGSTARLSLARTAQWLIDAPPPSAGEATRLHADDVDGALELTAWGSARRLKVPAAIEGLTQAWRRPATRLGSSSATWH